MCVSCLSLSSIAGGKFPRPFELNTDIVTWTRLLTRADRGVGDVGSPALSHDKDERVKGKSAGSDSSPPLSPLTPSGESTPKSPLTPPQGVAAGMVQGTCKNPPSPLPPSLPPSPASLPPPLACLPTSFPPSPASLSPPPRLPPYLLPPSPSSLSPPLACLPPSEICYVFKMIVVYSSVCRNIYQLCKCESEDIPTPPPSPSFLPPSLSLSLHRL